MNKLWLNKKGNENCILFFNGWGMDQNAIAQFDFEGFDVCHFNNYRELENIDVWLAEEIDLFSTKLYLVAWSMGVWAAEKTLAKTTLTFEKKIAINGTGLPVSKDQGIPAPIFKGTLAGWNEANRKKFEIRMMGGRENYQKWAPFLSDRKIEEQQAELASIYENAKDITPDQFGWSKAFIGEQDLIFPFQNQQNFWKGRSEISALQTPHFPFGKLKAWEELIVQ